MRAVLAHFKNRLALANRQLNADMSMQRPPFKKLKSNRPVEAVPNVTDDLFQQELYFIDHEIGMHMPPLARATIYLCFGIALEQEKKDHLLAEELNKKEYEETGQMIECGCCCSEYTFDDMAQCTSSERKILLCSFANAINPRC